MYLAVDVHYDDNLNFARIAGVLFNSKDSILPVAAYISEIEGIEDYKAGEFYRRELPCIQKLIHEHNLVVDTLIVDGFVHLNHQPCLGAKVAEAITSIEKVIGVAKNPHKLMSVDTEVVRANSRPLYVTETGIGQSEARDFVESMHGKNRIPTMLKLVDSLCRKELTQGEYRVQELKQGHIRRIERTTH
ncbi:hypothetical protein KW882_03760 [Vibrio parahaemolyticus]